MRDLGLTLLALGLVIAGAVAVHYATRTRTTARHKLNPPGEEDTFVAELRGQPADRFTPGVVLPFTPQLGEPLKPQPGPDNAVLVPPSPAEGQPASAIRAGLRPPTPKERLPEIDMLVDEVKQMLGLNEPAPEPPAEPLLERYERLFPHTLPSWAAEINNWHTDNAEAVESMWTRADAAKLRAMANGQVTDA